MGGAIRVITIKDGTTHKQTRWTNSLTYFVHHDKFIEKNSEWWNEYITKETDYSSAADDFSPEGYGLVVLDYDKKLIFSCQEYSSLRNIYKTSVALEMDYVESNLDYHFPTVIKRMISKGMLKESTWNSNETPVEILLPFDQIMKKYADEIDAKSTGWLKKCDSLQNFYIDFEKFGWEYNSFEKDEKGYQEYYIQLQKHYSFTESEQKHWEGIIFI